MTSNILTIGEKDRTPLVDALLLKLEERDQRIDELMESVQILKEQNQALMEQNQVLRDEIAALKKTSKRPKFPKPKNKPKKKNGTDANHRPGSKKAAKKESLRIDETKCLTPDDLPEGAVFKRRRSVIVQELRITSHNTKFVLEEYIGSDGKTYSPKIPQNVAHGHFGVGLIRFVLYQYHHCQVTQPLLREMLQDIGVDISIGQINNMLTENVSHFHEEKDDILRKGLEISSWVQTDDTGARHQGKTGYCTHIGNELFAWFGSTDSKSRINFLQILGSPFGGGYALTPMALRYMKQEKLPKKPLALLENSIRQQFADEESWLEWLGDIGIKAKRHIRIATEGALLGQAIEEGLNPDLIVLSDDDGQFNIPLIAHALCWIHAIRHIKKLVPPTDRTRSVQEKVLSEANALYDLLKQYREKSDSKLARQIEEAFDTLFKGKTEYETLNQLLKRIDKNRKELLLVLDHPQIPIHNNGSEGDIREFVKRRKVSGGTRSSSGRRARDTFASLKKTCRKLTVSFWDYLGDRLAGNGSILSLPKLMEDKAAMNILTPTRLRGAS